MYKINLNEEIDAYNFYNSKSISNIGENDLINNNWQFLKQDTIFNSMKNNIGIGFFDSLYLEVDSKQNIEDEYKKIIKFLKLYLEKYAEDKNIQVSELQLELINYGKSELVYVLTDKAGKQTTLIVKQPAVKFGKIKQEFDNLRELNINNSNVIMPIDYYNYGEFELYTTPYIYQARSIACYESGGIYIPEPFYRFEPFTKIQSKMVNICMLAKIISLYDFEKQEGLCKCKLGGGDFIISKGWELKVPTIENTLNNLYLIAAREKVRCSFEFYLEIIRNEFSKVTVYENPEDLIINMNGRVPIKMEDIELGIQLGKKIIESRNNENIYNKTLKYLR